MCIALLGYWQGRAIYLLSINKPGLAQTLSAASAQSSNLSYYSDVATSGVCAYCQMYYTSLLRGSIHVVKETWRHTTRL